jgi:hypothetical protein
VTVGRRANLVLRPNADCRFRLCCLARPLAGDAPLRNPITGIAGCCARAARGHAAAAPPRSVTKRRRSFDHLVGGGEQLCRLDFQELWMLIDDGRTATSLLFRR